MLGAEIVGFAPYRADELGPDGFYPPVQYSALWLLLGLALVVLVIAWIVVLLVITRRRRSAVGFGAPVGPPPMGTLRENYLGLIDDVTRAHAAGLLDFRQSHQRLSLIVREFAGAARGIRAPYMTLDDLRAQQVAPLSATVGELYPGAFSGTETGSVAHAAERARTLVDRWQ